MNRNRRLRNGWGLAATCTVLCAVFCLLWYHSAFLPRWIHWKSGTFSDRTGKYDVFFNGKSVCVTYDSSIIWNSPDGVKVQDALTCDIDNDREDELVLLCWKKGRYGPQKPFWADWDERTWSQHIFIYEYEQEKIRPKWMSSYIGQDVAEMTVNVGKASLNRLFLTDPGGKINCWVWDSWGFRKEDTDVSFAVFGDNLIHEPIYQYGLRHDPSFGFLFGNLKDIISQSDISVINQETPLTEQPSMYSGYPRFGTPAGVGQAIVNAGFDIVTCATNHALDKGADGVSYTKDFFTSRHVTCLGIQTAGEQDYRPYEIIDKNGIRFALLNYTYGTNGIRIPAGSPNLVHLLEDEEKIQNDIRQAKADSDCVILFVHWGTENERKPDEFQIKWTQVFLESEADVVIGTHPHTLQPYEVLQSSTGHEMLIYYSIGNYISAQQEKECVKGGMAVFTVSLTSDGYTVTDYGLQPLHITSHGGGRYTAELYDADS